MKQQKNTKKWIDPTSLAGRMEQYLEWMDVLQYSPRSVTRRREHLKKFLRWSDTRGLERPEEINKPILNRYQKYLFHLKKKDGNPLSARTQYGHLSSIRMFFRWLSKENYLRYNPASELDLPKVGNQLPRYVLSVEEVERILAQPDVNTTHGLRDRAMLEIMYSTGIRRLEVVGLSIWDLDVKRGTLLIRRRKGNKDRMVPIGNRSLLWLTQYLEQVRPSLVLDPDPGALFMAQGGKPLQARSLSKLVQRYMKEAQIEKPGGCHLFRHTMATLMLENGADIRFIQQMLGHQSLTTTQIYTQVSIDQLKRVHSSTHPAQ